MSLPGWELVMKPHLEEKFNNSWVNPIEAEDKEDLIYKYIVAWAYAKAGKDILAFMEEHKRAADHLEKKERGEESNNFKIGG